MFVRWIYRGFTGARPPRGDFVTFRNLLILLLKTGADARTLYTHCSAMLSSSRASGLRKQKDLPQGQVFLFYGADARTRTGDLRFTKALLYQLSYIGAA